MGQISPLQNESTTMIDAIDSEPLSAEELRKIDAYWRACNYCCVGMLYLRGEPAAARAAEGGAHQEPAAGALGFGTGQTFTWVHLNRLIKKY